MSWTWCIGMFLPVLLVRDYGLMSFLIFAIPNIAGAAAMGWVMRSSSASAELLEKHSIACDAFSAVTIAFQAFFIGWISARWLPTPWVGFAAFGALAVGFFVAGRYVPGGERGGAVAAALVSLFLLVIVLRYRLELGLRLPEGGAGSLGDLIALSAVCALGFLLCPYLDRTFHTARIATDDRSARWAFGIGFGLVFASMLVFTLLYCDLVGLARLRPTILWAIVIHMVVQAAFTSAAHAALLRPVMKQLLAAGLFVLFTFAGAIARSDFRGMEAGEFGYRLFMGFYGLVAPAYVLLFPARGARPGWGLLLLAVAAAVPFYWLAFMDRQMPWVLGGVAVVLVVRLLVALGDRSIRLQGR